jgi:hypothetical protein
MKNQVMNGIILALLLIVGCIFGGVLTYGLFPRTITETELVNVTAECQPVIVQPYNDTEIKSELIDLKTIINEDNLWKVEAKTLAEDQWGKNSYKYLFNFMVAENISIDEKGDIESVFIKDTEISFDVDDKDATVEQELKVYYEDTDGDDKKIYIYVTSIIENGEVEDYEFELI